MRELVTEATADLAQQGYTSELEAYRALEMRYLGQNYELELPIGADALEPGRADQLWAAFHAAHKARFGFNIPGEPIEIVNYTVTAISRTAKPDLPHLAPAEGPAPLAGRRPVGFLGGRHDASLYRREDLRAGHTIDGPAVVEEAVSVTVVEPGQRLSVDPFGHLLITAAG
jgi:N-methylhydantoinase A